MFKIGQQILTRRLMFKIGQQILTRRVMFKIGQQILTRRVRIKVICKNGVKPVYLSNKKLELYKLTSRIFCHLNMKQ